MSPSPGPIRTLVRNWHMLRHVPARQLARRAVLILHRHVEPFFPPRLATRPRPTVAPRPPLSVLPPRHDLVQCGSGGIELVVPWGRCRLWPEPDWHMRAEDEASTLLRAALHNMEYSSALDEETALGLMKSWCEANPFERRGARPYAWRPFNLSIRVVAWMRELAARGARWPGPVVAELHESLVRQLRYLTRRLETDLRGNHLLKNVTALLWGGAFFSGSEARSWYLLGSRLLERELAEQILADGCHFERSPTYQCQVMADLLDCRAAMQAGPLRERIEDALGRMARALQCLRHPDGGLALFNDGGLHASWPPESVLLGLEACGLRDPGPPDGAFALPDAGYWGFRRGGDYLLVDCGPIGPDYLVGHGHADILSFEWSTAGSRILVDQGTYAYRTEPRRAATRSTGNHNTVTIAGLDQSDVYDAHRCGRRAVPQLLDWTVEANGVRLRGTHDGFDHLPGRPRHEREILARPGELVIHDLIRSRQATVGEARYLLHPACRVVETTDDRLLLARDDVLVEVEASRPIRLVPAEWYPDMFVAMTTRRLICEVPAGETGTTLRFRRRSGAPANRGRNP